MQIDYGRTANVKTTDEMLELIKDNLFACIWAESDYHACMDWNELVHEIKDYSVDNPKLFQFLTEVKNNLEGTVGDIVFYT